MVIGLFSTFWSWEWLEGPKYVWWLPTFEFALRGLLGFWLGTVIVFVYASIEGLYA